MPLHHFFIYTVPEKFEETAAWYLKALAPLNYVEIMRVPRKVAMGANSVPEFWVGTKEDVGKESTHFAFKAKGEVSRLQSTHPIIRSTEVLTKAYVLNRSGGSASISRSWGCGRREVQRRTWTPSTILLHVLHCICSGPGTSTVPSAINSSSTVE